MSKVLMLNFKGDAVPFSYQVSDATYDAFKRLESIPNLENKETLIRDIEKFEDDYMIERFKKQMEDHKNNLRMELLNHERYEQAQIQAKSIFT